MADINGDIDYNQEANQPTDEEELNTLDEPVYLTIWRDVKKIGIKLFHVIIPRGNGQQSLRDWDLWGPLVFCLTLALTLGETAESGQAAAIFTAVFVIVWLGSVVITLNTLLLGGKVSFFQSLCVFGYCIFPLAFVSVLTLFCGSILVRLVLSVVAIAWASFATIGFISPFVPKSRKLIAMYPIVLFYMILGWMVLMHGPAIDFCYFIEKI